MMAGADLAAVQKIIRHTDPRIATELYGHLAPGCLRGAIDRLSFESPSPTANKTAPAVAVATGSDEPAANADPPPDPIPLRPFAAPVLQTSDPPYDDPPPDPHKPRKLRRLSLSGREDSNLRHPAPKNGGRDRRRWQRLTSIEKYSRSEWSVVQRFAGLGSKSEEFCSYFAPGNDTSRPRQAGGGSAWRPALCRRCRPPAARLRGDRVQTVRARRSLARPYSECRPCRAGDCGCLCASGGRPSRWPMTAARV